MRPGMMASRVVALVMWGVTGIMATAMAAPPAPLSITSDRLDMDDRNQVATFMGHVVADDGRMRLSADRMTVRYDKKPKGHGGVREVKAEGQVVIQQERDRGTADVVHYQFDKRTLELVGNEREATIRRGDDQLTGRRILVTLDGEQRISKVSVQGGENRRVSARITPSGVMQRMDAPPTRSEGGAPPPSRETPEMEAPPPPALPGHASPPLTPSRSLGNDSRSESGDNRNAGTVQVEAPTAPEGELAPRENETDGSAPNPAPRRRAPQPYTSHR
ncbi:MAG: lipopolysaccharide transport periplasmic protein LptA [Magnetococcales bacterium]|nr:lipopolysaccharide transport periplasmic protein LptA [Magnetococcales bacterium]